MENIIHIFDNIINRIQSGTVNLPTTQHHINRLADKTTDIVIQDQFDKLFSLRKVFRKSTFLRKTFFFQ